MSPFVSRKDAQTGVDPQLEQAMRLIVAAGLLLVILVPAARGSSTWLGWLPLWLVAMPAMAWWSLHRFRLPARAVASAKSSRPATRRRAGTQARRRVVVTRERMPRAA